MKGENVTYTYQVTFINDGEFVVKKVDARHGFEAVQLAGAFNNVVISVINLDIAS